MAQSALQKYCWENVDEVDKTMIQKIKNFLKRFLPPPTRAFNREVERILSTVQENGKVTAQMQETMLGQMLERLDRLSRENNALWEQVVRQGEELELLREENRRLALRADEQLSRIKETQRDELVQTRAELARQVESLSTLKADTEMLLREGRAGSEQNMEQFRNQQEQMNRGYEEIRQIHKHTQAQAVDILTAIQQQSIQASRMDEIARRERKVLSDWVERVHHQSVESRRYASEAVWAEIFNSVISGSTWLKNTAFSPGRWAVGYPALYVMYRVLNEARPKRILELGLGQSTRMIAQYAAAHEDVEHIVVEHDQEWIDFFKNDFRLSLRSQIVQLDREMVPYKEAEAVRVFKGFRETFHEQKFDFIFIDAPLGGDMKQYARIDVLGIMPDCLSNDFVIMIDDAERSGEIHTIVEMEQRLAESGIGQKKGRYSGKKDCVLISAEHMGFLTSM